MKRPSSRPAVGTNTERVNRGKRQLAASRIPSCFTALPFYQNNGNRGSLCSPCGRLFKAAFKRNPPVYFSLFFPQLIPSGYYTILFMRLHLMLRLCRPDARGSFEFSRLFATPPHVDKTLDIFPTLRKIFTNYSRFLISSSPLVLLS